MQIVRTEVTQVTTPSGQKVLRVQFCGEGCDCVTVDMSAAAESNAAIIERARGILVKTATFQDAVNDYDARSNGNFDELAVASASNEDRGVYIFEYRDGEGSRQVPPCFMPSREAALEEAMRCAIDLLVDLKPGHDDLSGWLLRVRGQNGDLLCSIDVQEAEAARQRTL